MNVLGASVLEDTATFGVWAPRCQSVDVAIEGRHPQPMGRDADGVFTATLGDLAPGTRYKYRLDGERYRPDPVSRWQPEGVHGASAVVDPRRFLWTDQDFRGHAPSDLVIYELHVGTFTAAGTFEAIVPHLPGLAQLGLRWRPPLRSSVYLWRPARAPSPGGRVPRGRALRLPRRRLQPPRPRGQLPRGIRAVRHRPVPDAVGPRGELRRRGESRCQTSHRREWARLGERVPRRRLPRGRGPRDPRREPGAHPDRVRPGCPRGGGARGAAGPRDRRVSRQ